MSFRKVSQLILLAVLLVVLAACGSNSGSDGSDSTSKGTITFGQINWPENIAVTNLWKAILEDKGYDVELKLIEMGPQIKMVVRLLNHRYQTVKVKLFASLLVYVVKSHHGIILYYKPRGRLHRLWQQVIPLL